jgi:uncharacterized integral membrane protein
VARHLRLALRSETVLLALRELALAALILLLRLTALSSESTAFNAPHWVGLWPLFLSILGALSVVSA